MKKKKKEKKNSVVKDIKRLARQAQIDSGIKTISRPWDDKDSNRHSRRKAKRGLDKASKEDYLEELDTDFDYFKK